MAIAFATQLTPASQSAITIGSTGIVSGATGSILFDSAGHVAEDNANFFYDSTNKQIKLAGNANGEQIRLVNDKAFIGMFNSAGTVRSGYFESTTVQTTVASSIATPLVLITNAAIAVTIDSSQNVGIGGTATASARTEIFATNAANARGLAVRGTANATKGDVLDVEDSTGTTMLALGVGGTPGLQMINGSTAVWYVRTDAGDVRMDFRRIGDGNVRGFIDPNMKLTWGDGAGSNDTNLYRSAAGVLKTDNSVAVATSLAVGAVSPSGGSPHVAIQPTATGNIGVQVKQFSAGQTGDLIRFTSSDSSTLFLSVAAAGHLTFGSGINMIVDTTTGSQIATVGGASGQKLGFFGATPVVQQLMATGTGKTVDQVITALQTLGLFRQT